MVAKHGPAGEDGEGNAKDGEGVGGEPYGAKAEDCEDSIPNDDLIQVVHVFIALAIHERLAQLLHVLLESLVAKRPQPLLVTCERRLHFCCARAFTHCMGFRDRRRIVVSGLVKEVVVGKRFIYRITAEFTAQSIATESEL